MAKGRLRHLGVIMDGNRRWARARDLPLIEGHRAGRKALERVVEACPDFGIEYLTVYAFSTENWGRDPREIADLMTVFSEGLDDYVERLVDSSVQMRFIGATDRFPAVLRRKLGSAEAATAEGNRLVLNVALGYGGRDEIVRAVKAVADSGVRVDTIGEDAISDFVFTAGQPDPDMVVRPAGVYRLSNFMPWQSVYSELYFCETLWPDFGREELQDVVSEFFDRERRFGR